MCIHCSSMLAFEAQMLVAQAVADHVNGGRRIIMKGLQSELGQRAFFSVQRAANFDELVQVLMEVNAPMLPRRPLVPQRGQDIALDVGMQGPEYEAEGHPLRTIGLTVVFISVVFVGAMAFAFGTSLFASFLHYNNSKL